ncbi:glutaredoxin 3 [Geoalkalibacter halelectricus]|uniref:Glutaredoxin n=1 Tax=Geoalkalibacter halelectricus TaxID=2847045 RepID=A0ABY5ZGN1_9BACT|nr:glutaredoxin 3 [Geoalkalibacter halelectricus]MDO3378033.1 glutaredoxin 3 [Geoalkalibacter halelectricus]UWZ78332.1 glutaredoxin 3 [Geoalkalibacter halelectricus]
MKRVEIYTKSYCPYCKRAKELLHIKGVEFIEYDVTDDPRKEQEMRQRSGRRTVPEIFIDDSLVGGCSDLFDLDEKGELDRMLGLSPPPCGESPP